MNDEKDGLVELMNNGMSRYVDGIIDWMDGWLENLKSRLVKDALH